MKNRLNEVRVHLTDAEYELLKKISLEHGLKPTHYLKMIVILKLKEVSE